MHAGLKRQDADADKISQKRLDCTIAAFMVFLQMSCTATLQLRLHLPESK